MELPLGGPALRHYTQSRPRPHRQKLNYRPSRPQETIFESENEVLEHMGRVDEGVEEFFTKKVLPLDILKKQEEEAITVQEVVPASSNPCPAPTKTLRRKLGDFFTLKKRKGSKTETTHDGRPKKASIADLIRPLREVARAEKEKDKDRVKEHDKENEKEKGESAVQEAPVSGAPPLRGETVPPRRALREGKSQSLILLSGSAAGTPNSRNATKKQMEGQNSFEQKLHLMLQRIGVAKPQPAETQNQEREMKKAESEGTIIDSKPEPPPSLSKPRTMSASSDTRHQIRPSVSEHESAGKPPLLPKPVIKPGPTNATSGHNTPENELALIQEGEKNADTKHSPCSTSSPPVAADSLTSTSTTSTVPTISNSVSDSSSGTVSPSSTVAHTDIEICTDSVKPIEQACTPTTLTEPDSKFTEESVTTTQPPTATTLTSSTSTTTPSEPPSANLITSISSGSMTQAFSDTSNVTSTTTASPSIITLEKVCEVGNDIEVSTSSPFISTESDLPEVNGNLSPNAAAAPAAAAAAAGDAAVSLVTSTSSPSTSSVAEAPDVSAAKCVTSISSVSNPTTPFISSDVTETTVSLETLVSASSTQVSTPTLPISSSFSSITTTASTKSPKCSENMTATASTITQPDTLSPSVPSTCNAVTEPGDITFTTAISLNNADTDSTTSSSTTAAVSSTLSINSDPAHTDSDAVPTNNLSTNTLTRGTSDGSTDHPTSPAHSKDSPDQNNISQTFEDDTFSSEPVAKGKADEKFEMVEHHEKTEVDKDKGSADYQGTNDAPTVSSEETEGIGQEACDSANETMVETPSGKEGECGTNKELADGQK